jgi:hypothetical protein
MRAAAGTVGLHVGGAKDFAVLFGHGHDPWRRHDPDVTGLRGVHGRVVRKSLLGLDDLTDYRPHLGPVGLDVLPHTHSPRLGTGASHYHLDLSLSPVNWVYFQEKSQKQLQ